MSQRLAINLATAALLLSSQWTVAQTPDAGWPRICYNTELLGAIRLIASASSDVDCKSNIPRQLSSSVDKPTLLAVLRNPYLLPIHVFFQADRSRLDDALDWESNKREQLESLKLLLDHNGAIFIIGQSSARDSVAGERLARERMISVSTYIENSLRLSCTQLQGGWISSASFELSASDAALLGIEPSDYRGDEQILNQAVHIFVFPCSALLPRRNGSPPDTPLAVPATSIGLTAAEPITVNMRVEREVTEKTKRQVLSTSTQLRDTARALKCVDSGCETAQVREALSTAHRNVVLVLDDAHYGALASYADEMLARTEARLPKQTAYLDPGAARSFLAGMAAAIDQIMIPKTHSMTVKVHYAPAILEFRIWPVRYPEGGKPIIPSGATITLNRGKYRYQFDKPSEGNDEKHMVFSAEISLIDAIGSDLVCGGAEKFAACAIK